MKKILTKPLASVLSTLVTATFSMSSVAAEVPEGVKLAKEQTLVRGNGSEPASLDPHKVESSTGGNVLRDLFEGLLTEDGQGNAIPGQAESWTVSKDNKVFTFNIRDTAKWSNGDPVTAHDFVYSFQRVVDPETASPYA